VATDWALTVPTVTVGGYCTSSSKIRRSWDRRWRAQRLPLPTRIKAIAANLVFIRLCLSSRAMGTPTAMYRRTAPETF